MEGQEALFPIYRIIAQDTRSAEVVSHAKDVFGDLRCPNGEQSIDGHETISRARTFSSYALTSGRDIALRRRAATTIVTAATSRTAAAMIRAARRPMMKFPD
jgi:hypothetical protein